MGHRSFHAKRSREAIARGLASSCVAQDGGAESAWARRASSRSARGWRLRRAAGMELALVRGMTVGSLERRRVMGRCAVVSSCQACLVRAERWWKPRSSRGTGVAPLALLLCGGHGAVACFGASARETEGRSGVHERRGRVGGICCARQYRGHREPVGNGVVRDCSELMRYLSRLGQRQVRSLPLVCVVEVLVVLLELLA